MYHTWRATKPRIWPFVCWRLSCAYGPCEAKPYRTKWRVMFALHNRCKHPGDAPVRPWVRREV